MQSQQSKQNITEDRKKNQTEITALWVYSVMLDKMAFRISEILKTEGTSVVISLVPLHKPGFSRIIFYFKNSIYGWNRPWIL